MFILIEGIDGAGKGLQKNLLAAYLAKKYEDVIFTEFPDHQGVIYKDIIHPVIHQEITVPAKAKFLAFVLDQMLWQDKIALCKNSKEVHFVCDGYYTTALVYQAIMEEVIPIKQALSLANDLEIIKPDLAIYLDVDPEVALQRKLQEEGHEEGLDMYEGNIKKQKKIRAGFKQMVEENIFCEWLMLEGGGTIEEINAEIIKLTEKKLK